jgi:transcription antitermination factor NusG
MTYSELNQLTLEELRNLNSKVVEVIKLKRSEIALDIKDELRIGMNVSVNHPKLNGKQLRVEKINRTKAVLSVLNTNYGRPSQVSVPLSMIQING